MEFAGQVIGRGVEVFQAAEAVRALLDVDGRGLPLAGIELADGEGTERVGVWAVDFWHRTPEGALAMPIFAFRGAQPQTV